MAERNDLPPWVKGVGLLVGAIGLPGFMLLWTWGAFDRFMPSPVVAAVKEHDEKSTRIQRLICKGVWRGNEYMQEACDR